MKVLFNIFKWTVGLMLVFLMVGVIFEQVSRVNLNAKRPDNSQFVDLMGRQIHFVKKGRGGPTVVFESGLGGDHTYWTEIQKETAKHTTTLSYDRAGIFWSDPIAEKSLGAITQDLETVLEKTDCPKPYIIVGHSFAGIITRQFIKENIDDIQGIVWIDVSHPSQLKETSEELMAAVRPPSLRTIRFFDEIGAIRLLYTFLPFSTELPKEHFYNQHAKDYFYAIYEGLFQEYENDDTLFDQASRISGFSEIPLTIVTASYPDGIEFVADARLANQYFNMHQRLQKDLLNLSTRSNQVFATKSGHHVPLQEPGLILEEIQKLITVPLDKHITL
nr:alpha/beta hydrolase [uncultured Allomuricauda sp.]